MQPDPGHVNYRTDPLLFRKNNEPVRKIEPMITCYLRYIIDPHKLPEFEQYARLWPRLVEKFGGIHHGYFLPHEGANNMAVALFSFPSLAAYEKYRTASQMDKECIQAYEMEKRNKSIISYERSFMRPLQGAQGLRNGRAGVKYKK